MPFNNYVEHMFRRNCRSEWTRTDTYTAKWTWTTTRTKVTVIITGRSGCADLRCSWVPITRVSTKGLGTRASVFAVRISRRGIKLTSTALRVTVGLNIENAGNHRVLYLSNARVIKRAKPFLDLFQKSRTHPNRRFRWRSFPPPPSLSPRRPSIPFQYGLRRR